MSNKINRFDRDNLDPVTDAMMSELAKVGEKFGVTFGRKGCRYSEGDFRVTVTCTVNDRSEGVETKQERAYNTRKETEGLPDLGYEYYNNGITMTVVGWNSRARKYQIQLKGSDGKGYKCSPLNLRVRTQGI